MNAVGLSLAVFAGLLSALLVAIIRGSFEDPIPLRAGTTWAVTCPGSGLLFGVGLGPLAIITAVVSCLALGSLAWWFLVPESDDSDSDPEAVTDPDPGPSDDMVLELPTEPAADDVSGIDWDAFDRARADWERAPLPDRV
jgi:hypothetical protein